MLFSISWRNVWRNKLRSTVIIIALTLGICAGVFSSAFFKGLAIQRIDKVIKTEISHIQIHQPEYRQANDISKYIPNANKVAEKISEIIKVATADYIHDVLAVSPKYCIALSDGYISSTMKFIKTLKNLSYIKRDLNQKEIFDKYQVEIIHPEKDHYKI